MAHDARGREIPDPTPVEVPLKFRRKPSREDDIRRLIREVISGYVESKGFESFKEADDFDISDDQEMVSPYEMTAMQEEFHEEVKSDGVVLPGKDESKAGDPARSVEPEKEVEKKVEKSS